jgi:alpha-tubulin suppressor-like RCC1 family protein
MTPIGFYPASTFEWSDGSTSQMAMGTPTYLQVGGEVADSWPNGAHTDTAMVSDRPAWEGYEYAAYQRDILYFDSTGASHTPALTYLTTGTPPPTGTGIPASEGDLGMPGLCGLDSGGWTDASGTRGAYSITSALPAGNTDWGEYFYFGGGALNPPSGPALVGNFPRPLSVGTAGDGFACAVNSGGGVECWGDNSMGQLGNGTLASSVTPLALPALSSGVTAVSAGGESACAIQSGAVLCWGGNIFGELGIGNTVENNCFDPELGVDVPCAVVPTFVSGLPSDVTAVSVGNAFACALTAAGAVWCWGDDESGALGDNGAASDMCVFPATTSTPCAMSPVQVQGLGSGVTAISAGNGFACAVRTDGHVLCWGIDNFGEVGSPAATMCGLGVAVGMTPLEIPCTQVPTLVQGVTGAAAVSTDLSGTAACAITQGGGVLCWGNDGFDLGNGTRSQRRCDLRVHRKRDLLRHPDRSDRGSLLLGRVQRRHSELHGSGAGHVCPDPDE